MKIWVILLSFLLLACQQNQENSENDVAFEPVPKAKETKNTPIEVKKEEIEIQKTAGELCDFYDYEAREILRVFIVKEKEKMSFFRVSDSEDIAYLGFRTALIDLYSLTGSDLTSVPLTKGIINDNGVSRSHHEIIKAIIVENEYSKEYILERTRFLRDTDKHTREDWEKSYPEPFKITHCIEKSIETRIEFLGDRKGF